MEDSTILYQILDWDIDRWINPWIPHNRFYLLPVTVSRWFGYRSHPTKEPYAAYTWPFTILATIGGLCLVGGIGNYAPGFAEWHPPVMIASLGASAILEFNTIKSPLSQPRNAVLGNTLAAICGVSIAKLFQHNSDFQNIEWVAGAVGCALASWVMSLTNTIHPPGGATAVLASTQSQIIAMGWRYVPIVMLDSVLLVCVALLFNNVIRQYPTYWWTPQQVGRKLRQTKREAKQEQQNNELAAEEGKAAKKAPSDASSDRTLQQENSNDVHFYDGATDIRISTGEISLPPQVRLSTEDMALLHRVQERLRDPQWR